MGGNADFGRFVLAALVATGSVWALAKVDPRYGAWLAALIILGVLVLRAPEVRARLLSLVNTVNRGG